MNRKDLPPITKNHRLWCADKSKLTLYLKGKFKGKIWEDPKCPEGFIYIVDPNYCGMTDK